MKPFNIVSSLIDQIEKDDHTYIKIRDLALQYRISDVHLQRLFKFMFGMPLASYIRSRRLALSIERLLNTDLRIIDIAMDSGFSGERAYIRAFKNEYGISPGEYRKSGGIMKVVPPFTLCDANMLDDGLLYGPDIVQVPHFYIAGQLHTICYGDLETPHLVAREFEQYMSGMPCVVEPNIYIGLTRINSSSGMMGFSRYLSSVMVKNLEHIPQGFAGDHFPSSLCARFRYIGEHHYRDITWHRAKQMYEAICVFTNNLKESYISLQDELFFERIDISAYDGRFCQMEWFTPIKKR